jgi:hypothetical protein
LKTHKLQIVPNTKRILPSDAWLGEHRAVRSYASSRVSIAINLLSIVIGTALVLSAWPWVAKFWASMLNFAWKSMELRPTFDAAEGLNRTAISLVTFRSQLIVPPEIVVLADADVPTALIWWLTLGLTSAVFIASSMLSRERLPLIYFLRFIALIMSSALIFYFFYPARAPMTLAQFLNDQIVFSHALMLLTPTLHGLLLYVFPGAWLLKWRTTLYTLLFLIVVTPLHIGSNAWLLQTLSLLYLPLFYILLSLLPLIVAMIALYANAVSQLPKDSEDVDMQIATQP